MRSVTTQVCDHPSECPPPGHAGPEKYGEVADLLVNEQGLLHFRDDVYSRNVALRAAMQSAVGHTRR